MAHFLLFIFVVTSQVVAGFSSVQKLPPPEYGSMITVLSIDGGGIKGIIPATVLDYLDNALKAKDPSASLAHYFDVIAGTSTGGLLAAMLASPSPTDHNRPGFTPAEIVQFYKENGPHIFNVTGYPIGPVPLGPIEIGPFKIGPIEIGPFKFGPIPIGPLYAGAKFDGEFLHNIIRELVKETRLNETLTNVVIPTYDVKKQKPVIFSNYKDKLEKYPYLNAKISDIAIATSAAPSQLPAYKFENDGVEFNMIDGGVAAGNPTEVAIGEVIQYNSDTKILVVSIGTGVTQINGYDADSTAGWLDVQWSQVVPDLLGRASTDMTEYYLATVFSALRLDNNYLRIQEYELDSSVNDPTNVTNENMENLEEAAKKLLQKNIVKINVDTFDLEVTNDGTYAEALDRLANIVYQEKELRLKRKSMEKRGRPFIQTI